MFVLVKIQFLSVYGKRNQNLLVHFKYGMKENKLCVIEYE